MPNLLTMRGFGRWGRWGNQLIQYMFLRIYARQHGCTLYLPPWVGKSIFALPEVPTDIRLPPWRETCDGLNGLSPVPPDGDELVNRDFEGYAQYHTRWYRSHSAYIQSLFQDIHISAEALDAAQKLRQHKTVVGIHVRRGDYGRKNFYITPIAWYLSWLKFYWKTFDDPVLFLACEDRELVSHFAPYDPWTGERLGIQGNSIYAGYNYLRHDTRVREAHQLDFLPDWYMLSRCDVLVTPHSTYSFAAGLVNPKLQRFFRSSLPRADIVEEDIWNTTPGQYDDVKDFPHLQGIALTSNPYW